MSSDLCNDQWYALRTRPRFEKLVSRQLRGKGYDEYLPVNKSRRCSSGRIGTAEMPIFAGYTFCKFHIQDRPPVRDFDLASGATSCSRNRASFRGTRANRFSLWLKGCLHQFRNEAANNLRGNPEFPVSERSSVIEDRFSLVE